MAYEMSMFSKLKPNVLKKIRNYGAYKRFWAKIMVYYKKKTAIFVSVKRQVW